MVKPPGVTGAGGQRKGMCTFASIALARRRLLPRRFGNPRYLQTAGPDALAVSAQDSLGCPGASGHGAPRWSRATFPRQLLRFGPQETRMSTLQEPAASFVAFTSGL